MKTAAIVACALTGSTCLAADFSVCADYSCKTQHQVKLSRADWQDVRDLFTPPAATALEERAAIQQAIARLESLIGASTGTSNDKGGNVAGSGEPGQMDCIDESTNTTHYLNAMQDDNLLSWHQVGARESRSRWIFDIHWTATIADTGTGVRYAIDSWFRDNGDPPVVQELAAWRNKQPW